MEREMELEKAREAERQKKLEEAAVKQQARMREIEEREVCLHTFRLLALSAATMTTSVCLHILLMVL